MNLRLTVRQNIAFLFVLFLFFNKSFGAEDKNSTHPLEIKVKDILATGAVYVALDELNRNFVAYGIADAKRISIDGRFSDANEFIEVIAKQLQLKTAKVEGFSILSNDCMTERQVNLISLPSKRLSLNFQRMELNPVLFLLQDFYEFKIEDDWLNNKFSQNIAIRGKVFQGGELLAAISTATGRKFLALGDRKIRLEAPTSHCITLSNSLQDAVFDKPPNRDYIDQSNAKGAVEKRKEPLEAYDLEKIAFKGYARRGGTIFGIVETADGMVRTVKNGNYLGKDFGKIIEISSEFIRIREIKKNAFGIWAEYDTKVEINSRPMLLGRSGYEDFVERSFAYIRSIQETPSACGKYFPESFPGNSAALKRWIDRNSNYLVDIEAHMRAYAERQAAGEKYDVERPVNREHADAFFRYIGDLQRKRTLQSIESLNGGVGGARARHCGDYAAEISNPSNSIKSKFGSDWENFARCESEGLCDNLNKFRRN